MASSTSKSSSTLQQRLPVVVLKRNKQSKSFRDGGQLVFGGSIDRAPKNLKMGDIVQVYVPDKVSNNNSSRDDGDSKTNDKNNTKMETPTPITLIGWGVYNPESMYRVRLLCHGIFGDEDVINAIKNNLDDDPGSGISYDQAVLRQILMKNFERAINTRRALGLPSASVTDTYRLVNGEGDSLSGLAVDVVGDQVAVVMSSAAWCEIHQHTIIDCLQTVLPDHYEIIWKKTPSRLQQDGYHVKVNSKEERDEENLENGKRSTGLCNYDRLVIATENEIKYNIWPFRDGQKTSVYCDQRINRWNLAQHCSGKNVLDLCCYHGGFSLNAAKNGAMNVIGVDSSQDAVDACKANAELNNMGNVDFVKSDISDFMKICSQKFDVVVLDPPKLAPSVSGLQRASRKYHSLNRDALKLINDSGGLFMTCTCSAAMTQQDGGQYFLQMVHQAALAAKRQVTLISVHGAAPCHTQSPITLPAGKYLTAALFMVHPK
jgi:23S rRNA G2069 N7-methylase RlmK/C1962 C5-methylase RlmI